MNIIKGVAVRKLSRQYSISLAIVALCVIVLGVVTQQHVSDVRDSWNEYAHVKQGKRALINELTATIGFDGAVHHFKNLILKRDSSGIDEVHKEFGKAQALIRDYRDLNLSERETQALNDVSGVVAEYQRAVGEVSVMLDKNATIAEIDQVVKIEDSLALDGLAVLSDVVSEDFIKISSQLEEDLSLIESHTLFGTIVSSIALCVLLAFLVVTFRTILLQIGGEPKRIMAIADRIADGDLSEALEDGNKSTGVYAAVVSIQSNLRDIAKREESSQAYSEQLRQALDNASSNVMVADTDNNIIFINKASRELFQSREKEIISTMPHFKASEIVGSNIDIFHKKPEMQKSIVRNLSSTHKTAIEFGGCTFSFFINPVVTESGRRLGTIVEWFDKTIELKSEAEVQLLVQAAAKGDLSRRIDTEHSTNFFKRLGQSMNELMEVNDRAVSEVQRVFAAIACGDLTAKVEGEYQGVYQQLKNDANATVNQLTEVITNVKNSAMIIAAASSELISTNKNLNDTAEDGAKQAAISTAAASNVTENVNAVAHAATEMESSVKEITRNVTEAVDVASQAVTLAQSTNTQVRKLTTSSSDIGNVIKVINSIAEQTNLLALNATIEAARAGDAGKGFAVVANEVKELAKGTAKATDEIAQKINAIQGDSDTAVQAIGDISKIIETISNYQNTISAAVQDQNLATQRISENASEASLGNVEITQTSKRVSDGTESTVRGVSEVQTSAEELSRLAVGLSSLVDGFKVDTSSHSSVVERAA